MSRRAGESWGPSHQQIEAPFRRRRSHPIAGVLVGVPFLLCLLDLLRVAIGFGGGNLFAWTIRAAIALLGLRVGLLFVLSAVTRPPRLQPGRPLPPRAPAKPKRIGPAKRARNRAMRLGGGAYLGASEQGEWVTADRQSAVMVLGPPRSGKTSAVMIPALMGCAGAALSTSTKPDVMRATVAARAEVGQAWLFDPSATEQSEPDLPAGVRRLCWSPVAAGSVRCSVCGWADRSGRVPAGKDP